jgi:type I restriction enzyme R subunit
MSKSNFEFLKSEYPTIASLGELAEASLYKDPSNTLSKLRIISEKITLLLLQYEGCSDYDFKDQFTRLKILQDQTDLPITISEILHSIRKFGNNAAHSGEGNEAEARFMLRKMFQLCCWFYSMYETPVNNVDFVLPVNVIAQDNERIALLEAQLKSKDTEIAAR